MKVRIISVSDLMYIYVVSFPLPQHLGANDQPTPECSQKMLKLLEDKLQL